MSTKQDREYWLKEENLIKIKQWYRDGLRDIDVANKMGISRTTLYNWEAKTPGLKEMIKAGKVPADDIVESALFKRAVGYDFVDPNNPNVTKHIPGDVTAMIFWLKNRNPERWHDSKVLGLSGNLPVVIKDDIRE